MKNMQYGFLFFDSNDKCIDIFRINRSLAGVPLVQDVEARIQPFEGHIDKIALFEFHPNSNDWNGELMQACQLSCWDWSIDLFYGDDKRSKKFRIGIFYGRPAVVALSMMGLHDEQHDNKQFL